jgi:hypothetical protein
MGHCCAVAGRAGPRDHDTRCAYLLELGSEIGLPIEHDGAPVFVLKDCYSISRDPNTPVSDTGFAI